MKKSFYTGVGLALLNLGAALPAAAEADWVEALKTGETDLHLRMRYEGVEQEGVEDASALTLKTRLTYLSGTYRGFGLALEMDDVTAVTDVDYNDGTGIYPGATVIADPEGTEVNQAYLSYHGLDTTFRYGRQRILLDNQRFVGGVGWRQNEQTYDAFSVANESLDDLRLFYAYIFNVNRIFGETVVAGDHHQSTHLFNGRYSGWKAGEFVGYAYMIDNEDVLTLSSNTYGVRWEGKINEMFAYNLEYAAQSEAADNPLNYSADYLLAEGVANWKPVTFKLGYEILGSDEGSAAFTTPLATLHAFQGWTDKFLATPANGVEDLYLSAGTQIGAVNLAIVYHDLAAEYGDLDYGSEIGLVAGTKVGPVALTLKYADYNADDHATDTQKLWLMAAATF